MKKLNKKTAIEAATLVGGATAGLVAVHAGSQFIPEKFGKFVAPAEVLAGGAIVALVDNKLAKAVGAGIAVHGIVKGVNQLTAPSVGADGSVTPATGIKAMIANHMPALNGIGAASLGYAEIMDSYPAYQEPILLAGSETYNDSTSYNQEISLAG